MQGISSCFCFILDYADIFRFPLTLILNKKEKTSTYTGKFITLGILAFLIYSFIKSDVLNKKNAQTLSQDLMQTSRPFMAFLKQNFTMSIGVADGDNIFYSDDSIFSIYLTIYHQNNKDQTLNQSIFKLELCSIDDYIENPAEFISLGLNGTFCLPNQSLYLGGYWDEPTIDYFYFDLMTCVNSSDNPTICQSQDDINSYLKNNYLDIYMSNHNIDSSNYESPLSRNLKMYYQQLDPKILKTMNLYIKDTEINTDDGFFFEAWHTIHSFIHGDMETDVTLNNGDTNIIYTFTVYSSNYQTNVERTYQKIQTLLAQLGGICNFLFLLGFLLSKVENHYRLISLISNELYIFPKISQKKSRRRSSIKKGMESSIVKQPSIFKRNAQNKDSTIIQKLPEFINDSISNIPSRQHIDGCMYSKTDRLFSATDKQINENGQYLKPVTITSDTFFQSVNRLEKKLVNEIAPSLSFHESEESRIDNKDHIVETPLQISPKTADNVKDHQPQEIMLFTRSAVKKNRLKEKVLSLIKLKSTKEINISMKDTGSVDNFTKGNLEHYQKIKNKENFFTIGFFGFIKLLFKNRKCRLNYNEKLFVKGEDQIAEELDILHMLKKLQDIEKLKRILLSDEQLYLFNLLSKPMIVADDPLKSNKNEGNFDDKRFKFSIRDNKKVEKSKLIEFYSEIRKKAKNSDIDKRMMKLLDEDVMCFLENEKIKNEEEE